MALLTTISSVNRIVEQGDTYVLNTEPALTTTNIMFERTSGSGASASTTKVYDKQLVQQWKGTCRYSKRYKYVGLDEANVNTLADTIYAAYTLDNVPKYGIGIQTLGTGERAVPVYCYMSVGNGTMTCASVTPVHVDGPMWEIQVSVDATFKYYTPPSLSAASAPSATTLKALAGNIDVFPESGSN